MRLSGECCLSKLRLQDVRCARPIEDPGTGRAELQPAPDEAGDDAALVRNILLAKPHDVRRAGGLILLRLSERGTGCHCQRGNHGQHVYGFEQEYVDVHGIPLRHGDKSRADITFRTDSNKLEIQKY